MEVKKKVRRTLALLLTLAAVLGMLADATCMTRAEASEGPEAAPEQVAAGLPELEAEDKALSASEIRTEPGEAEPAGESVPGSGTQSGMEPESESIQKAESGPEPSSAENPVMEARQEAASVGESVLKSEMELDGEAESESESDSVGNPVVEPKKELASAGESVSEPESEPDREAESEPDADSVENPVVELKKESASAGESTSESEAEPDGETAPDGEPDGNRITEQQSEDKAKDAPGQNQEVVPEAEPGGEPAPDGGTVASEEETESVDPGGKSSTKSDETVRTFGSARASYPLYVQSDTITFEDGVDGTVLQGRKKDNGVTVGPAGTQVTFPHCPVLAISCRYCGNGVYRVAPMVYGDQTVEFSDPEILGAVSYTAGVWNSSDGMNGSQCMHLSCRMLRPGRTEVTSHYFIRYDVYNGSGGVCPWCRYPMVKIDNRGTWYECEDTFAVEVYADYVLEYAANAGDDPVSGLPASGMRRTCADSVYLTVSEQKPVREGYTFLGWADQEQAVRAQYAPEDPVALYWTEGPQAKKTLYAVWEREEQSTEVNPPGKSDLEKIAGCRVRVHCVDEGSGHPDKIYGADPSFEIGAVYVREEGAFCDIRLDGRTFAERYSQESEVGSEHVLAPGEEAVRSITLWYDEIQRAWIIPEDTDPEAVAVTFLVTEGETPSREPSEPDLTVIKKACKADTEHVVGSVKVGEEYDYVVSIENRTAEEVRDIQVSEELNTDLVQLLQNPTDYQNGIWKISSLPAYKTATLRLHVRAQMACEAYENRISVFLESPEGGLLELLPGPDDQMSATVKITEEEEPQIKEEPDTPKDPTDPEKPDNPKDPADPEESEEPQKPEPLDTPKKNRPGRPGDSSIPDSPESLFPPIQEDEETPEPVAGIEEREEAGLDSGEEPGEKEIIPAVILQTAPLEVGEESESPSIEVSDTGTPLSDGSHRCCILHFCILLLAMLVEICDMRSRKKHQRKLFEIQKEMAEIQNRKEIEEEREC